MIKLFKIVFFTFLSINAIGQVNGFNEKRGYTVVSGSVINRTADIQNVEFGVDDWLVGNGNRRQYFAPLDSCGNFTISFFVFNPQDVLLIFKSSWHAIFVAPNDSLYIKIDADNFPEGNIYSGLYGKNCRDYLNYKIDNSNFLNTFSSKKAVKIKELSLNQYQIWLDSIYKIKTDMLNKYSVEKKHSQFFRTWLMNEAYLRNVLDNLDYFSINRIPPDLKYINAVDFNDSSFFFNSSSLAYFVNRTIGAIPNLYEKQFIETLSSKKSTPAVEQSGSAVKPKFDKIEFRQNSFNSFIDGTNVVENKLFREVLIAHKYLMQKKMYTPIANFEVDSALKHIEDVRIRNLLLYHQNKHDYQNRDRTLNIGQEPSIIKSLIDKNKGDVLCIYFWGTWCAPCLKKFEWFHDIERKFENEKVKFVYACCISPKNEWEDFIKKQKLVGEHLLVSSAEYSNLSKEYDIASVPKLLIINENGVVIDGTKAVYFKQTIINSIHNCLR
jgi:thiol-disulfide isomerase/thioredoxin